MCFSPSPPACEGACARGAGTGAQGRRFGSQVLAALPWAQGGPDRYHRVQVDIGDDI